MSEVSLPRKPKASTPTHTAKSTKRLGNDYGKGDRDPDIGNATLRNRRFHVSSSMPCIRQHGRAAGCVDILSTTGRGVRDKPRAGGCAKRLSGGERERLGCSATVPGMVAGPYSRCFYERDPREVAPALLGAMLVHGRTAGRIVETEAYLGAEDPAAHAYKGRTPRTEILFGPAGRAYVYRCRAHHCLNVAVQQAGVPGCVLIRAVRPVAGIGLMRQRRGAVADAQLADGPAKLCQAMDVDMRHYGVDLAAEASAAGTPGNATRRLTIVRRGKRRASVVVGPRIGVSAATDWPLRYRLLP